MTNSLKGTLNYINHYMNPEQNYVSGEQFLIKNIDFWEEWTGHAAKFQKKTSQVISDFFKEQFGEQFSNVKPKQEKYKKPTKEDSVPFDDDMKLFTDADFDSITEDVFETIQTNNKNLYGIIKSRLRAATRPDWHDQHEPDRLNDFRIREKRIDRMIIEDCMYSSSNRIEILQLTAPGANNIPAHLKIEDIMKFNPSIKNLAQATVLRDVLKSLGLGFSDWITKPIVTKNLKGKGYKKASLSARVRDWCKQKPKRMPWEAPVGKDKISLADLAFKLNDLERQEQDNPDWGMDESIAYNFSADWQAPTPEPITETLNTVGEYTYLKISRIPDAKEFGKSKYHKFSPKEFRNLIQSMDDMTNEELAGWYQEVVKSKRGSFEQKDRFEKEYTRVLNSRAKFNGEITICEPVMEPVEEQEIEPICSQFEEWQLDAFYNEMEGWEMDRLTA